MTDRLASFDQRQRYAVLAALHEACRDGGSTPSVLDVGGFFANVDGTPSLPARNLTPATGAIVVDRERWGAPGPGAEADPSGYCRADARDLPFADRSFDVVSCLDVLEHVPPSDRQAVVRELCRVCAGWLLVAVPIADDGAPACERLCAELIADTTGATHQQLKEHAEFGVPTHAEMEGLVPSSARSFGYGNLDRWLVMMLATHYLLAIPHNVPALGRLEAAYARLDPDGERRPPFYRRYYVARVGPDASDLVTDRLAATFGADARAASTATQARDARTLRDMLGWLLRELVAADPERLAAARAPGDAENAALRTEIDALRTALDECRGVLRSVEDSPTYKLSRLIRRIVPRRR